MKGIPLLHLNIANLKIRLHDVVNDDLFKLVGIISLNETKVGLADILLPSTIGLDYHMVIFCKDWNSHGGGVALIVKNDFCPHELTVEKTCELIAVQICQPFDMITTSVYRPPLSHVCKFVCWDVADNYSTQWVYTDVSSWWLQWGHIDGNTLSYMGFKKRVEKPTHDRGTIIDHVYVTNLMNIVTDVSNCYYSDHDYVLCMLDI